MTKLTETKVPLQYPVPVKDAEGRDAKRDQLVMRRPKTRHAKQLAVVIGADLVKMLLDGGTIETAAIDPAKVAMELVQTIASSERLDALTAIVADMCGEKPELIDDLDLVDLFALAKAFTDFFPSLQSFTSTRSQPS